MEQLCSNTPLKPFPRLDQFESGKVCMHSWYLCISYTIKDFPSVSFSIHNNIPRQGFPWLSCCHIWFCLFWSLPCLCHLMPLHPSIWKETIWQFVLITPPHYTIFYVLLSHPFSVNSVMKGHGLTSLLTFDDLCCRSSISEIKRTEWQCPVWFYLIALYFCIVLYCLLNNL